MAFIQEAASAIKSRFGFQTRSNAEPSLLTSSPDLLTLHPSSSSSNLLATSPIRSIATDWHQQEEEENENGDRSCMPPRQCFDFSEDPSFWKDRNVQVIIRIRPLSSSEISLQGYNKCVRQESCESVTWTGPPESRFTFDLVADEGVTQEKLFKVAGLPMVENCMGGYNSCMFAYGQTGSGKTHTMLGDIEGGTRRHSVNCGMTPRVFEYLFTRIQKEKEVRKDEKIKFTCKCSFLEIYNEQILDLLDPSSTNLQIREDVKKGIYVENLKEIEVASAREVILQLIQGAANRKVAATNMNRASSRSHSVFTCVIESKWESQGVNHHRFARLNLVDLAGSERQKSSGAEGERLKEATNINKSLSTLGLVIMNLVSISNGKSLHVPYRDSKLTFLLQESLGGNSKTTIIANISPSICCSLETLSTLKFAQRAKFIKNNAIINEDASGDVIAMRMQIQQLKKEVARLRGLANGGTENQDNDTSVVSFLGSPGSLKWEGLQGSVSPLLSDKRMSQKKDYEVALVGAFKREKDKDIALKALTAENQAAMLLAKQREDEIQGLKMRLRFREAGIKRLEAVASGKISAETHLLKEKEEHLKEIGVLQTQVDRNQEVTRFAMENLRLKEEIRRLKSFYEEGERETMSEQVNVLQNKLLEALDWKLMHESDSLKVKIDAEAEVGFNSLISVQDPEWQSSIKEENEFLRMQAIHNQAEIDALHKQLDYCLEQKAKLEIDVNDLLVKLDEERSSRTRNEGPQQSNFPHFSTDVSMSSVGDQMEIKTMVDAIAAASNREAEALEKSIILSKENAELQSKLEKLVVVNNDLQSKIKGMIDEKNSLIEMYERAATESNGNNLHIVENAERIENEVNDNTPEATNVELKPSVEELEHQLLEMHEENEKLMVLYETAMHERDEFKRLLTSIEQNQVNSNEDCPEKLVEVEAGECPESSVPPICASKQYSVEEYGVPELNMEDREETTCKDDCTGEATSTLQQSQQHIAHLEEENTVIAMAVDSLDYTEANTSERIPEASPFDDTTDRSPENVLSSIHRDSNLIRLKLETAQEKLSDSSKVLTVLGLLEKAVVEFDHLSREITATEERHQVKQEEFQSLEKLSSELQERKSLTDRKLSALKHSLSNFISSMAFFEQREARAMARVNTSSSYLEKKKEELARVQASKFELEAALRRTQESEAELRNKLGSLKCKLEEENRKQENEKVLFSIENTDREDNGQQRNLNLGKATDLLKSEEQKTKLQAEITQSKEKLNLIRKEAEGLSKRHRNIQTDFKTVQIDVDKAVKSVEEMELALHGVTQEKETLLEMKKKGESEIQRMVAEYLQNVLEADLKAVEMNLVGDELQPELRKMEELRAVRREVSEKVMKMLDETSNNSCLLCDKMEQELRSVSVSIAEANALVEEPSSNHS